MTIDERIANAKRFLEVLEGHKAGKKVQFYGASADGVGWRDCDPTFAGATICYRLKPEQKEIFVNEYDQHRSSYPSAVGFSNPTAAENDATTIFGDKATRKAVLYREVIDE